MKNPYEHLLFNGINVNEFETQCCFCGKGIDSSQSDPCSLNIMVNYNKSRDRQFEQFFLCHIACFKNSIMPNVPLYIEHLGHDE